MSRLVGIEMIGDYLGHGVGWVRSRVKHDGLPVSLKGRKMESSTKALDKWSKCYVNESLVTISTKLDKPYLDHLSGVIGDVGNVGRGRRCANYFRTLLNSYDGNFERKGDGKRRDRSGRIRYEVHVALSDIEFNFLEDARMGLTRSAYIRDLLLVYREGGGDFSELLIDDYFYYPLPKGERSGVHRASIGLKEDFWGWLDGREHHRSCYVRWLLHVEATR